MPLRQSGTSSLHKKVRIRPLFTFPPFSRRASFYIGIYSFPRNCCFLNLQKLAAISDRMLRQRQSSARPSAETFQPNISQVFGSQDTRPAGKSKAAQLSMPATLPDQAPIHAALANPPPNHIATVRAAPVTARMASNAKIHLAPTGAWATKQKKKLELKRAALEERIGDLTPEEVSREAESLAIFARFVDGVCDQLPSQNVTQSSESFIATDVNKIQTHKRYDKAHDVNEVVTFVEEVTQQPSTGQSGEKVSHSIRKPRPTVPIVRLPGTKIGDDIIGVGSIFHPGNAMNYPRQGQELNFGSNHGNNSLEDRAEFRKQFPISESGIRNLTHRRPDSGQQSSLRLSDAPAKVNGSSPNTSSTVSPSSRHLGVTASFAEVNALQSSLTPSALSHQSNNSAGGMLYPPGTSNLDSRSIVRTVEGYGTRFFTDNTEWVLSESGHVANPTFLRGIISCAYVQRENRQMTTSHTSNRHQRTPIKQEPTLFQRRLHKQQYRSSKCPPDWSRSLLDVNKINEAWNQCSLAENALPLEPPVDFHTKSFEAHARYRTRKSQNGSWGMSHSQSGYAGTNRAGLKLPPISSSSQGVRNLRSFV